MLIPGKGSLRLSRIGKALSPGPERCVGGDSDLRTGREGETDRFHQFGSSRIMPVSDYNRIKRMLIRN